MRFVDNVEPHIYISAHSTKRMKEKKSTLNSFAITINTYIYSETKRKLHMFANMRKHRADAGKQFG